MSYPADVLVSVRGEARRTVPPDRADIAGTIAVTRGSKADASGAAAAALDSLTADLAAIGGVALVTWLALSDSPFAPQQNLALHQAPPGAQTQLAATPANGAVNDYLLAHQQFSPSTAMQGVASYVRTVSGQNPEQR